MHIMVAAELSMVSDAEFPEQVAAVAFELNGKVCEPHELLQAEDRWLNYPDSVDPVPVLEELGKFCGLWLGKRGKIWATCPPLILGSLREGYGQIGMLLPWGYPQEHDLRTLLWMAGKVPQAVKAPVMDGKGLRPHYALHTAATSATMAQAAFRAIMLGPQSQTPAVVR